MAGQKGILPVQGTVGNITFFKSGDGYGIKAKSSISASRIASDPAFERTRENGAEFGRAGAAGKTLRMAFAPLLQYASDRKLVSRLVREMMRVVKSDTVNIRGMRNVVDGDQELLTGFEFNITGPLSTTLRAPFTASINRVSGELKIEVEPFVPAKLLNVPPGSSHFTISIAGAEVDFSNRKNVVDIQRTAQLPWNNLATAPLTLTSAVSAGSGHPLFLAMGVEFYQESNGILYPLKSVAFNSLALIAVSGT